MIAVGAATNLGGAPGLRLVGPLRIGDQLAAHADDLGMAGLENRLGIVRRSYAPGRDHRDLAHAADRRVDLGVMRDDVAVGREAPVRQVGLDRVEVALRQRHEIDRAAAGELGRGADALLEGDAAGRELLDAQSIAHDIVRPDRRAHLADDVAGKGQPLVVAAAIRVGAPVAEARDELLDQMAVAALDLDTVEPGLAGVDRREHEAVDHLANLRSGHLVRRRAAMRAGDRRRRPQGRDLARVMLAASVAQLAKEQRAFGPHRLGQARQPGQTARIVELQGSRAAAIARVDRDRLGDDAADATFR